MMEERTKICCLDVDKGIIDFLSKDFDVYNGSLGRKIKVDNNGHRDQKQLLLNYNFPDNLHEYDVLIDEMRKPAIIPYNQTDHKRSIITGQNVGCFISCYPETVFDPIPFGCHSLAILLAEKRNMPILKILFQNIKYDNSYSLYNIANGNDQDYNFSNYAHIANFAAKDLTGKKVSLCENKISKNLFENYLNKITYLQTYKTPTIWDNEKGAYLNDDAHFLPLLQNQNGDIISYLWMFDSNNDITLMLPQIDNNSKVDFIKHLFNEILYSCFPKYFPLVEANAWTKNSDYYLPEHENLLNKKEENKRQYEKTEKQLNEQILTNQQQYDFLHKILTETGSELVNAVITFLKWLGFENAIAKDETSEDGLLEEDIQVDLGEKGLLIIEVKGIGGTSKDAECSQIHKIKFRRCEERCKFDVYALYIVNNERHLPPINRTIPPFNPHQIKDAINDKRGMLYTWQLFNLYFNIQNGFVTKEIAREKLLTHGLIDFSAKLIELGKPYKYYQNNKIVCVDLNDIEVNISDFLVYEINGRLYKQEIIGIQQEKQPVIKAIKGKCGFELANSIPNIEKAYLLKI